MPEAWLYNGREAARIAVRLEAVSGRLQLELLAEDDDTSIESFTVSAAELAYVDSRGGTHVYGHRDNAGWRLIIPRPVPGEIHALLPGKPTYGGLIDRIGLPKALITGLAASALILFAGYRAPTWLARHVPYEWEQEFGGLLVGDLGHKFCRGREGQAALNRLATKLTKTPTRYKIRVVDLPVVNAAALPGGTILVFDELLKTAKSSDEVAGVLAHEIAHVDNRHVTEAMIRQYGFNAILTTFGGAPISNLNRLASARYSRESEAEADAATIEALQRASVSPVPTAVFFSRLALAEQRLGRAGEALGLLSSHPPSKAREKLFKTRARKNHNYVSALSPEEWKSLQSICRPSAFTARRRGA